MARKKTKVSSMKYVYDGDGSLVSGGGGGGGFSNAAINAGFPSSPALVSTATGGTVGEQNSASVATVLPAAAPFDDQTSTEKELIRSFYEKLDKLHHSSGLSLLFNFQETKFDLHLFYNEVTQRGGFHQVSKEGKWKEVACALNLKRQVPLLLGQVQKLYETLLLQYEQMHYYRTPAKLYLAPADYGNHSWCSLAKKKSYYDSSPDTNGAAKGKDVVVDIDQESKDYGNCLNCRSLGKRKPWENSCHDDQVAERKGTAPDINLASTTGPGTPEQKMHVQIHFDDKDIKDLHLPTKPRTAYRMFVKMECDRLRNLQEESSNSISYRNMATEAWRRLSKSERVPYVEASQKDKARFNRDMLVYEQIWNQKIAKKQKLLNNSSTINFGTASPPDDGYYVTLEEDDETEHFCVPDESLVETTVQILKGSHPNDPMFQINWDGCCYDSPNSGV